MALLKLPTELRLEILELLPELAGGQKIHVSSSGTATPAISRTCRLLRLETLALYVRNARLIIALPKTSPYTPDNSHRREPWTISLQSLPTLRLSQVQLRRQWETPPTPSAPMQENGFHLQFDLVFQRAPNAMRWDVQAGTYPVPRDLRGMRHESTALLKRCIEAYLDRKKERTPCLIEDLVFVAQAMDLIAQHPIPIYDLDQDDNGLQGRRSQFNEMENAIIQLSRERGFVIKPTAFYTPY
jgi:hypothetical protein